GSHRAMGMAMPINVPIAEGPAGFLLTNGAGRSNGEYRRGCTLYSQGDPASAVYFVIQGRVLLSVVSPCGREAVVGIIGPGEFFGEGSLVDEEIRESSAVTLERSNIARIERQDMKYVLRTSSEFCDGFVRHLLRRKTQVEEALADQLFSCSERRLARVLLLLARDSDGQPCVAIPRVSQTTLAAIVGTTRSRISYFLAKFRKMGLVEGGQKICVNPARICEMLNG